MTGSSQQIAARLLPLCFVIACQGETTPTTAPASPGGLVAVVTDLVVATITIVPDSQMVFVGDQFTFTARPKNKAGQVLDRNVKWTVGTPSVAKALDSLKQVMTFKALKVGTTTVKATVDAKYRTAKVVVRGVAGAKVVVTPAEATVVSGATVGFVATGLTKAGEKAAVNVTWTATGGTISTSGVLTAGNTLGTYQVIARSAFGAADTSIVNITVITAAPIDRVTLLPEIAASRAGETTRFVATVWNTLGDSVPGPVTYESTCGTVTGAGVFTAPLNDTGPCLVTAAVDGKTDTSELVLLPNTPNQGIPFGLFSLWTSATTTQSSGVAPFTASHDDVAAGELVSRIVAARAKGVRLLLALTGGSHELYKTDGVFDLAKWEAAMDEYNTPAIKDAVAEGVADGTIIGNSVMDEPQQSDRGTGYREKSWGPTGTMTKVRVDGLCAYVKAIFPTLPVGVFHDHSIFEPDSSYRVCEFLMAQYGGRKGNIFDWRDAGLALAARDGMVMLFSLNFLDGGLQDKDGTYDCAGAGQAGKGTYAPNCQMTTAQVREWGDVLGQAACALMAWRYDKTFMTKPENQAAVSDVAITLSRLPRTRCTGR